MGKPKVSATKKTSVVDKLENKSDIITFKRRSVRLQDKVKLNKSDRETVVDSAVANVDTVATVSVDSISVNTSIDTNIADISTNVNWQQNLSFLPNVHSERQLFVNLERLPISLISKEKHVRDTCKYSKLYIKLDRNSVNVVKRKKQTFFPKLFVKLNRLHISQNTSPVHSQTTSQIHISTLSSSSSFTNKDMSTSQQLINNVQNTAINISTPNKNKRLSILLQRLPSEVIRSKINSINNDSIDIGIDADEVDVYSGNIVVSSDLSEQTARPSRSRNRPLPNLIVPEDDDIVPTPNPTRRPRRTSRPRRRRAHAEIPITRTYKDAMTIGNRPRAEQAIVPFVIGNFDRRCDYCFAKYFSSEKTTPLSCCKRGDIVLQPLGECPSILKEYLTEQSPMASEFRENIRSVNSLFAMATFKANIPAEVNPVGISGHWCFTICGQVYHYCQAFVPADDYLKNNQYYFVDADEAVQRRNDFLNDRVCRRTISEIERMLRQTNQLIQGYMTVAEIIKERTRVDGPDSIDNLIVGFRENINRERRNFALPESRSEIAAVFEGEPPFSVDLKVYPRTGTDRHEIKNLNKLSDPMVYPLLFPHGEYGFDMTIKHAKNVQRSLTFREFYRYRIHIRTPSSPHSSFGSDRADQDDNVRSFSILHNSGKLFQQYLVDAYVKIEANELWWYKCHRKQIRHAGYDNLLRYLERRAADQNCRVGRVQILPSGFHGGYRYQNRQYLDALNVIGKHGKPDLFITFTCNPGWKEIIDNLEYRQKWQNRPDLICRVFHSKLLQFIDDIVHKQLYGVILNYFYVVEFQKRGLPHAHILVTFYPFDKLNDPAKIDSIITATIPDIDIEPELYGVVAENYIHRKCSGNQTVPPRCWKDGKCSKGYPKQNRIDTVLNYNLASTRDGRPEYCRPNDGRTITVHDQIYTNRDIVPYNRYAALKYRCHINFEGVGSLASVKYLYKYVTKGDDMCTIEVVHDAGGVGTRVINWDEIESYVECRYISSVEACWRLFEFKLTDRSHSVTCLPIHLENRQIIAFHEDEDEDEIVVRAEKNTKLTAYFLLNSSDPFARQLRYIQIPENYRWDNKQAVWIRRAKREKVVGAIVEVSPAADDELFCMRVLLQHVVGATSFEELKMVPTIDADNVVEGRELCATYREACHQRRLFMTDDFYDQAMREAAEKNSPHRMRRFFALIILLVIDTDGGQIQRLNNLWHTYKSPHMIADYLYRGICRDPRIAIRFAYECVERIIKENKDDVTLRSIGIIDEAVAEDGLNIEERADLTDDIHPDLANADDDEQRELNEFATKYRVDLLTPDQKRIYENVVYSLLNSRHLLNRRRIVEHFEIEHMVIFDEPSSLSSSPLPQTLHTDSPYYLPPIPSFQTYQQRPQTSAVNLLHYADGPGGTGKTFLYNVLASKFLTNRNVHGLNILSVAWTGIAASLVRGGRTCHKAFRLPLDIHEFSKAGWPVEHWRSRELAKIDLILWDEISMTSRFALEAVDRYLRDITNFRAIPFGNKAILFGGDFRQTLPIVIRGHRTQILQHCVLRSPVWRHVASPFRLETNLRAQRIIAQRRDVDPDFINQFATWLLDIGNGNVPITKVAKNFAPKDLIKIPSERRLPMKQDLIDWVYGDLSNVVVLDDNENDNSTSPPPTTIDFSERVILCPTNASVGSINKSVLDVLPGESKTYYSIDEQVKEQGQDDEFYVPLDLLHSIETSNLPPHELTLKRGAVVMLLRNIDVSNGQCNGCRYLIRNMFEHRLEIEALTGPIRGKVIWLPKTILVSTVPELARPIRRIQFPIKLSFAMTINKSQGQTFGRIGIYLPTPCFAHGQLYVAFSRVGDPDEVKVVIENTTQQGRFSFRRNDSVTTRNVVYREVFSLKPETPSRIFAKTVSTTRPQQLPQPQPQTVPTTSIAHDDSNQNTHKKTQKNTKKIKKTTKKQKKIQKTKKTQKKHTDTEIEEERIINAAFDNFFFGDSTDQISTSDVPAIRPVQPIRRITPNVTIHTNERSRSRSPLCRNAGQRGIYSARSTESVTSSIAVGLPFNGDIYVYGDGRPYDNYDDDIEISEEDQQQLSIPVYSRNELRSRHSRHGNAGTSGLNYIC